jgi:murein DD-endopeptidase MepM/ murein hydrolase activator NlpD
VIEMPRVNGCRRLAHSVLALLVSLSLCVLLLPESAIASKSSDAARLKSQLADIQADLTKAGREYDSAFWELDETEVSIQALDEELADTTAELDVAQGELHVRLNSMYRSDPADYLSLLLGSVSFQDMVTRLDYLQRIGRSDAQAVRDYRDLSQKLTDDRAALQAEHETRSRTVDELKRKRDALQADFKASEAEYDRVKAELAAVTKSSGSTSAPGANGMTFPVQGVNYFSDTWGASRSGGRRTHKGTDIMARKGTPCVAVLSGSVQAKSSSLGGQTIWLTSDNGWRFYYAHLDSYAVTSGRVRAGQVIGYVGSTGNASASSPHLHFEIHPNGGSAVNPYPFLKAMQ